MILNHDETIYGPAPIIICRVTVATLAFLRMFLRALCAICTAAICGRAGEI